MTPVCLQAIGCTGQWSQHFRIPLLKKIKGKHTKTEAKVTLDRSKGNFFCNCGNPAFFSGADMTKSGPALSTEYLLQAMEITNHEL